VQRHGLAWTDAGPLGTDGGLNDAEVDRLVVCGRSGGVVGGIIPLGGRQDGVIKRRRTLIKRDLAKVEVDTSLALSEDGDLWFEGEGEYDLRVTQRLVLQPRLEFSLFAQDIPERLVGAGLGPIDVDLRLRYEFTRRFAPYLGLRYHVTVGETADLVEAAGGETEQCIFLSGLRIAW